MTTDSTNQMLNRARAIAKAGSLDQALADGTISEIIEVTLSEALVLGLLRQGVRKYLAIFGHGSTDLGEVLRVYQEEGVTQTFNCRNEVAMAHAATALAWQYGETPAVVTSIGPGALQAMAGSLAASSNGVGVYHIYGDETTSGEGYNMQQIPKERQGLFGQITSTMWESYCLHTPAALPEALRRGTACVNHPYKAGPFYLLLPLNTQPQLIKINLTTLPPATTTPKMAPANSSDIAKAVDVISQHGRITIKAGGGTRGHDQAITKLAETIGASVVLSPGSTGVMKDGHPQNMHVGGSKGSISGNYAMQNAELLIAIGTRGVCQADCSGIGYPNAKAVININGDLSDLMHYAKTTALPGDITEVIKTLCTALTQSGDSTNACRQLWLKQCAAQKALWRDFKQDRFEGPLLPDAVWQQPVLGQPAAIKIVADFAKSIDAAKYFDAGDVQANGFQIVEDDHTGDTYTETGASYMGFAVSGLLASAFADTPRYSIAFTGDGSFMMNPQILIDGIQHGLKGMIILFDNRRMAAITGLQQAQYGQEFRTNDSVAVDYVKLASAVEGVKSIFAGHDADSLKTALTKAHSHNGLSLVHVPVYFGDDPLGGMGAYGDWNVGNWVDDVQAKYLKHNI